MKLKKQLKKILDKTTNNSFFQTLKLIKKNKKTSSLIIISDLIFVSLLYTTKTFSDKIIDKLNDTALITTALFYALFVITTYSLFKYLTIKAISSFTEKQS